MKNTSRQRCRREVERSLLAHYGTCSAAHRFGKRAAEAFSARAAKGMARQGLTTFPDEPVPVTVPGAGGVVA